MMFMAVKARKLVYFLIIFLLVTLFSFIHAIDNNKTELVILMYHSVLKDTSRSGKYIVTPQTLESDINYLNSHGYKSVLPSDLISYVNNEKNLPKKLYLLTFDDGSYNNLTYVLPILQKNNAYALISVVGSYCESFSDTNEANPAYSYLRWTDIKELLLSKRVEIGNHSYNLHSIKGGRIGAKIMRYEDEDEYIRRFSADVEKNEKLLTENCNHKPYIYTYPFGAYCEQSEEVLKQKGYLMSLICEEGINEITRSPKCLNKLKRYNRSGSISTDAFFKGINIK